MRINEFKEYLDEFIEDVSFSEADGEGTVKLMTAHASKGLEFPIVIAVGLSKNFSSQDIKNQVLMDYGVQELLMRC
jgi:ATP-dependent helicase/nuclease subunit A